MSSEPNAAPVGELSLQEVLALFEEPIKRLHAAGLPCFLFAALPFEGYAVGTNMGHCRAEVPFVKLKAAVRKYETEARQKWLTTPG